VNRADLERRYAAAMDDACAICARPWATGARCRRLGCGHVFHVECIDEWARVCETKLRVPTCAICRTRV